MSTSATDFSCSDSTYDPGLEDMQNEEPPAPKVQPHNPSVVGTPAPEQPDEQKDDPDSS